MFYFPLEAGRKGGRGGGGRGGDRVSSSAYSFIDKPLLGCGISFSFYVFIADVSFFSSVNVQFSAKFHERETTLER